MCVVKTTLGLIEKLVHFTCSSENDIFFRTVGGVGLLVGWLFLGVSKQP